MCKVKVSNFASWNVQFITVQVSQLFNQRSCFALNAPIISSFKAHSHGWTVSKVHPKFFNFVCNLCQSSPSLTIFVPLWLIISLVFFYLCKILFSGFLQFNGNFCRWWKELKIPRLRSFKKMVWCRSLWRWVPHAKGHTGLLHLQLGRNFKDKILIFT